MKQKIHVFLFDGYADWEIAYLTPEINKSEKYELFYFSTNGDIVTSMGGLQVKPAVSLADVRLEEINMLILPGGHAWERGENKEIENMTNGMFQAGKPIAAICAATTFLGQLGILDHLDHTSNDLYYLKAIAPNYTGENHYQDTLATTGKNIITAKGIAPIEFAVEVFKALELYSPNDIEKWFQLFKNGVWMG
jgi:putative intracellular protease/amidase